MRKKSNKILSSYTSAYFEKTISVVNKISRKEIEAVIKALVKLKKRKGRLFLLGVGGSAANCSHAVNDFRKICNIEAYTPGDNVAELTARINDDGWESSFVEWLKGSRLSSKDAIMVLSVGGGDLKKNTSANIVAALKYGLKMKTTLLGIISRDGGYTRKVSHFSILIPVISKQYITPMAESFQALLWHCIVNFPGFK